MEEQDVIHRESEVMERFRTYLRQAIQVNEKSKAQTDRQVSVMLKQYNDQNVDLFDQISVALSMQGMYDQTLRGFKKALLAPFFARIDFHEDGVPKSSQLYIGKNGVNDENGESLIVDWRAPVANLYYNSELGRASYTCLEGEIFGDLSLKRTFTLEDGRIVSYYDSDVVTNDTLLQEYLAKNSDVVLKDIVATIQKDQNEIIRIDPWVNVIVQGVAGSGKTTVAMHRISYILYTFADRYAPEQIVIIGTSRMFLNYVAGMLPELGVENITQAVLPDFLSMLVNRANGGVFYAPYLSEEDGEITEYKSSLSFCRALSRFADRFARRIFPLEDVEFYGTLILSGEEAVKYGRDGTAKTLRAKRDVLKNILDSRIKQVLPGMLEEDRLEGYGFPIDRNGNIPNQRKKIAATIKTQARSVKNRYDKPLKGLTGKKLYEQFLTELMDEKEGEAAAAARKSLPHCKKGRYDLHDLCAALYLSTRLEEMEELKGYRHLVLDEAQDFGISIFWILKQCIPGASFTIMGDISQNIAAHTGLDSWDEVREKVFADKMLDFRTLSKSYRNTIEIAEVANTVLQNLGRLPKGSPSVYDIDPVVRHGKPVRFEECGTYEEMLARICSSLHEFKEERYKTAAIICKTLQECEKLQTELSQMGMEVSLVRDAGDSYEGGVTIFPIQHVKGMEFDAVILAGAGESAYRLDRREIKLLYVAVTRGLHELHIYSVGKHTALFGQTD